MKKHYTGMIIVLVITLAALRQTSSTEDEIKKNTLLYGRDVITNGEISFPPDHPGKDGNAHNIHDGDKETALILPFPGPPPEGTFILFDAGLSHFPLKNKEELKERLPVSAVIYNGSCTACPENEFREIPRMKKIRFEFLQRRANDPDVDFYFPETKPLFIEEHILPDKPGPYVVSIKVPPPAHSRRYPENTFLYRMKITVLDVYPGRRFHDRVAAAEVEYYDREINSGSLHLWK